MTEGFDWQEAVHDPQFWAVRYQSFPGISDKDTLAYFYRFMGHPDDPGLFHAAPELVEGNTISFPLFADYTWHIEFWIDGTYHSLLHPEYFPAGRILAVEGGQEELPGLRWIELKQLARCCQEQWQGPFDKNAIIPLLFPIVDMISFDEVDEVCETLTRCFNELHVMHASPDTWFDDILKVYDRGTVRQHDEHGWHPVAGEYPYTEEYYWEYNAEQRGWQPIKQEVPRADIDLFRDFFIKLAQCIPPD